MPYISLPGAPNGLLVNDLDTTNDDHDGLWKVSYVFDEMPYLLSPIAFVRRQDAERAKAAIEPLADWTLSMPQVMAQLKANGVTRQIIVQQMAEAMQW